MEKLDRKKRQRKNRSLLISRSGVLYSYSSFFYRPSAHFLDDKRRHAFQKICKPAGSLVLFSSHYKLRVHPSPREDSPDRHPYGLRL